MAPASRLKQQTPHTIQRQPTYHSEAAHTSLTDSRHDKQEHLPVTESRCWCAMVLSWLNRSPCKYAVHNNSSLIKPWCSCCCRCVATEPEPRHYYCKAWSRRRKVLLTVQRPDSWDQTSQFQLVVSHTLQHNSTLITSSLNHNSNTPQIKTPQSADLTTKKY